LVLGFELSANCVVFSISECRTKYYLASRLKHAVCNTIV